MKIKPYIDKLNASAEYKKFKEKYKDAFLVAGFFVLDLEMKQNIHQIDFYIPSKKKFAAFTLDGGVTLQILDAPGEKVPEEMDMQTNIDLDAIHGILEDEMKNRSITEEIRKIIAVVQTIKGKKIWNINSILSGMDILKAHIEDSSETILKMEKTSFVDIMKRMPTDQMQMPGKGAGQQDIKIETGEDADEAKGELAKLEELGKKIEEEKVRLKKEVVEKEKKSSGEKVVVEKRIGNGKSKEGKKAKSVKEEVA